MKYICRFCLQFKDYPGSYFAENQYFQNTNKHLSVKYLVKLLFLQSLLKKLMYNCLILSITISKSLKYILYYETA
jgi:hypothetical protein